MEQEEIVLTINTVKQLGLDKLEIITSDMLEGYTSIGYDAFGDCSSIKSITIPNSVTSIGDYAFYGCSSITSIIIPNSITTIGNFVFNGCDSLTSIIVESGNVKFDSRENCNAIIETATNTIIAGCKSTTIPNSVTSIGNYVFEDCISINSITIPNSVTSIGYNAFAYCRSLKSIKIPNSVICIGGFAFERCDKLKNIVIGDKTYKTQEVIKGKFKAYKAFNSDLTCRDFQYEEGKTYEIDGEPELCKHGFHACLRLTDVFNHYRGKIGKDIVVHEVELEGVSDEMSSDDSKVVAKKITIGKRIL